MAPATLRVFIYVHNCLLPISRRSQKQKTQLENGVTGMKSWCVSVQASLNKNPHLFLGTWVLRADLRGQCTLWVELAGGHRWHRIMSDSESDSKPMGLHPRLGQMALCVGMPHLSACILATFSSMLENDPTLILWLSLSLLFYLYSCN